MDFDDLIENLEREYWATLAANPEYQDPNFPALLNLEDAPSFYDFLLSRGFSKQMLSAYGIGRDVTAG
jgi:hypothetical protein